MVNTQSSDEIRTRTKFKNLKSALAGRLKDVRGNRTQKDIAIAAGVKQQLVSRWENGEVLPDAESLILLSKALNKSIDWLLTGKEPEVTKIIHPPALHVENVSRFQTFSDTFAPDSYIPIRLLPDPIAAGAPSEVREDEIVNWVLIYASKEWMPNDPEHYTCCHVRGQSMYPVLNDGDIVAIGCSTRRWWCFA